MRDLNLADGLKLIKALNDEKPDVLLKDVTDIMDRVSVVDNIAGEDSITILYSSSLPNNTSTNDVVKNITFEYKGKYRIIDNTDFGKLAQTKTFEKAFNKALVNESKRLLFNEFGTHDLSSLSKEDYAKFLEREKTISSAIYGGDVASVRECMWGKASDDFVKATKGKVEAFIFGANKDRVFGVVELREVLKKKDIEFMGESYEHLNAKLQTFIDLGYSEDDAYEQLFEYIKNKSASRYNNIACEVEEGVQKYTMLSGGKIVEKTSKVNKVKGIKILEYSDEIGEGYSSLSRIVLRGRGIDDFEKVDKILEIVKKTERMTESQYREVERTVYKILDFNKSKTPDGQDFYKGLKNFVGKSSANEIKDIYSKSYRRLCAESGKPVSSLVNTHMWNEFNRPV